MFRTNTIKPKHAIKQTMLLECGGLKTLYPNYIDGIDAKIKEIMAATTTAHITQLKNNFEKFKNNLETHARLLKENIVRDQQAKDALLVAQLKQRLLNRLPFPDLFKTLFKNNLNKLNSDEFTQLPTLEQIENDVLSCYVDIPLQLQILLKSITRKFFEYETDRRNYIIKIQSINTINAGIKVQQEIFNPNWSGRKGNLLLDNKINELKTLDQIFSASSNAIERIADAEKQLKPNTFSPLFDPKSLNDSYKEGNEFLFAALKKDRLSLMKHIYSMFTWGVYNAVHVNRVNSLIDAYALRCTEYNSSNALSSSPTHNLHKTLLGITNRLCLNFSNVAHLIYWQNQTTTGGQAVFVHNKKFIIPTHVFKMMEIARNLTEYSDEETFISALKKARSDRPSWYSNPLSFLARKPAVSELYAADDLKNYTVKI
jgi:hypothetical protein